MLHLSNYLPNRHITSLIVIAIASVAFLLVGILLNGQSVPAISTTPLSDDKTIQSIAGDCRSRQSSANLGASYRCKGDFRFVGKSPNGTTLTATVSGQHNKIQVLSVGNPSANTSPPEHPSTVTIKQSGNGSSATVTFAAAINESNSGNNRTQWELSN